MRGTVNLQDIKDRVFEIAAEAKEASGTGVLQMWQETVDLEELIGLTLRLSSLSNTEFEEAHDIYRLPDRLELIIAGIQELRIEHEKAEATKAAEADADDDEDDALF